MAVRRMQDAENQLRHYENSAKPNLPTMQQILPTMHEESNELRKALKNQEELHAKARSELEASRQLPHQGSQQVLSMPISSRTSESGWECIDKNRVHAFPVGTEVRSPEIRTPSRRSPVSREKINIMGTPMAQEHNPCTLCRVLLPRYQIRTCLSR